MCGIAGIIGNLPKDEAASALHRMLQAQLHRGPDDGGMELSQEAGGVVGLGSRRLAIIDTSPLGHQPMVNPDTHDVVAYNGEIYNAPELRVILERRGYRFRSRSDTEVLLRCYEEWGALCLDRLRGMFAFGLWDQQRQELFLARDPYGIKPLYYYQNDGVFLFASEIRTLLASGLVPRKLNVDGLESYLSFGSVQDPLTIIDSVQSLQPGHFLVVRSINHRVCVEDTYYANSLFGQKTDSQKDERPSDRKEAVSTLRSLLEESVQLHLVSDVPLGVFLSGGIDSSALVGLMSRVTEQPPQTFSISFPEEEFSERSHAEFVARKFGTEHQDLQLSGQDLLSMLPDALAAMDQPTMDGVNSYVISKAVKNAGITVALSGLGGDELFAGYPGFRRVRQLQRLAAIPRSVRRVVAQIGGTLMGSSVQHRKAWDLFASGGEPCSVYRISRQLFSSGEVTALTTKRGNWDCPDMLPFPSEYFESADSLNAMSLYELHGYMANTLLRDTDQMSMAHALEVRVPFIDPDVVSFILGLPGKWKFDGSRPKPLLLDALGDLLPEEVWRRPKMGFVLPFAHWMNSVLRPELDQMLRDEEGLQKLGLHPHSVSRVWQTFNEYPQKERWSRPWALYVLATWLQRHEVSM